MTTILDIRSPKAFLYISHDSLMGVVNVEFAFGEMKNPNKRVYLSSIINEEMKMSLEGHFERSILVLEEYGTEIAVKGFERNCVRVFKEECVGPRYKKNEILTVSIDGTYYEAEVKTRKCMYNLDVGLSSLLYFYDVLIGGSGGRMEHSLPELRLCDMVEEAKVQTASFFANK